MLHRLADSGFLKPDPHQRTGPGRGCPKLLFSHCGGVDNQNNRRKPIPKYRQKVQMKSKTLPVSSRTVVPAITAALAAAGLIGSAQAAIQTAGALLVDVNATSLPSGALASIANAGTMGGVFEAGGTGASIAEVYGPGTTKGILLDGNGFLQHKDMVGGVLKSADPGLTGVNPTASIEAWVLNPSIPGEETIVSWGHRNGPDGSNMSFNYGYDARWGAVGHWGSPDIGWDSCCNSSGGSPPGVPAAGEWHHLVYTFDGTT